MERIQGLVLAHILCPLGMMIHGHVITASLTSFNRGISQRRLLDHDWASQLLILLHDHLSCLDLWRGASFCNRVGLDSIGDRVRQFNVVEGSWHRLHQAIIAALVILNAIGSEYETIFSARSVDRYEV